MTKEQEEAIEYFKKHINYFKEQIKFIEAVDSDYYDEEYELYKNRVKQFETVLSMLKEKDKKIEKKDKIIDLMAEFMKNSVSEKKLINEICIKGKCNNEECHEDNWKECIKQYFERKSEE